MSAKHTPGPWTVEDREERLLIWSDNAHDFIAQLSTEADGADDEPAERWADEQRENAEFIVRACNAHDELVAAAESALARLEFIAKTEDSAASRHTIAALRAAITKAGAK